MTLTHAVTLDYTLNAIAHVLNIGLPSDMIRYSRDDPHGGYNDAYDDGFPVGSMWRVEGQMLYALVRALRPMNVLELGTSHGCSATHILQALSDNRAGGLVCVDNGSQVGVIGDMIPLALKPNATIHQTSVEEWIDTALKEGYTYDLILEDAMHDAPQVEYVWRHADKLLNPRGVILSHDACHKIAGDAIREGIEKAGYRGSTGYGNDVMYVLIAPADCGFAIWRKGL